MDSSIAAIPIEQRQLSAFTERANRTLSSVKWTLKPDALTKTTRESSAPVWRESLIAAEQTDEVSILKIARTKSADPLLLTRDINHVLLVLRDALKIGMHLSRTYTRFSGLDQLITQNERGALAEPQKVEFRAKYQTASAITLFGTAYYAVWELSQYRADEVRGISLDFSGIPEVTLQDPVRAIDCSIFYYGAYLDLAAVKTDLEFVKLTLLYFRGLLEEIKLREESLKYTESFSGQIYKLENSEFTINGFKLDIRGAESSVEFNKVELDEIVGNREAKHDARRLASRLLCYDAAAKKNPFLELGGLSPISMGYGEPGTGKSLLIAALATLLDRYCTNLGVPFLFWPMPDTVVSTFQGGSAERMLDWMRPLKDPSRIIYAPIDDAENNLEDRSRQGVSAGVREVIAVFLRNTEGAYAVNRGNTLIQLFTNLPEQIDKAVLSRINNRTYIGGARSKEDFLDQDHLWMNKIRKNAPDLIKLKDPKSYQYLSSQAELKSLSQLYDSKAVDPQEQSVKELLEVVSKSFRFEEQEFYGELFKLAKERHPLFSSRDVRNIQRAIDSRLMDFDLPEEWLVDPELFYKKSYDAKKEALVGLMRENLKGLSFSEVRLQETVRYLDNMVRIGETGTVRKINELVEELEIRDAAAKRFSEAKG